MSGYYIVGVNHQVTTGNDSSHISAVTVAGTTYVVWRESTTDEGVYNTGSVLKMTASTDGVNWTTPLTVYSKANRDVFPAGLVHDGTYFRMAVCEYDLASDLPATVVVRSNDAVTWTAATTVTWSRPRAWPTDLRFKDGQYYLAGMILTATEGPWVAEVQRSPDLVAWTSLGNPSQRVSIDNVWPRIEVSNGVVTVAMREGDREQSSYTDNILVASWDGKWGVTEVAVKGGGNPDLVRLPDDSLVLAYQDWSVSSIGGQWSWALFNGDWIKRGVVSQNGATGSGGAVVPFGDQFAVVYAARNSGRLAPVRLFFRTFLQVEDDIEVSPRPTKDFVRYEDRDTLTNFSVEISYGTTWISLTDHRRFYMSSEDFGDKSQSLRRITAQSPYYEGTYLVHAVRENVTETISVYVLGSSQNQVTENILLLEELVSQFSFRVRLTLDDHVETWKCQQADYTIQRGHVLMHNGRAMMRLSINRLPDVAYEVNG